MTDKAQGAVVEVRCEQIWIVNGNDSFRLAYEAESDAAANWYADRLRAALKAQPAPTEAQGEVQRLRHALQQAREWTGHADNLAVIDAALSNSREIDGIAAQGEDSARLDASDITSVVHNDRGTQHTLMVYFKTEAGRDKFRDVFGAMVLEDRARASTETGGVKS